MYAPATATNSTLPADLEFRSMSPADIDAVLEIIREHDEDDYKAAKETYQDSVANHYVLTVQGVVFGVTGAVPTAGTDNTFALSWTYLHAAHRGVGLGKVLIEQMLDELSRQGARKVFASTSDYVDHQRGDIYESARRAYEAVGFNEELRHPHYYERNETLITLGLRLQESSNEVQAQSEVVYATIEDYDEIEETDDAYFIDWSLPDDGDEIATAEHIAEIIGEVQRWKGRVIFVGIPSDAISVSEIFLANGFRMEGKLKDFYADGIHELHYRYDLTL